jgi:hypothetical protein
MSEQSHTVDCSACPTHDAVLQFSKACLDALARKVVFRLQRVKAIGIYDEYEHRTLWDEYCHDVQNGPDDFFEQAWETTVDSAIHVVVEAIPRHEAALLTIAAIWNLGEDTETYGAASVAPELICRSLKDKIAKTAVDRDMARFDPLGFN